MDIQPLIAGVVGGVVSTTSLYPLELIKTRMQVIGGQNVIYSSFSRSIVSVFRTEGIRGFFQGLSPAVFAASGSWGGYLYFYEKSKNRKLAYYKKEIAETAQLGTKDHLLAGFEAGVLLVFLFNPFWVIKTRLALQGAEANQLQKYNGATDAFKTIYREEGIAGFYKGIVPALFLTSHGAIQFATYEKLKVIAASFRSEENRNSQPAYMAGLLAGVSKVIASVSTYPYQVVKSRLQQREFDLANHRYAGTLDCIIQIWKKERWFGFFRGIVPNIVKVVPQSALTILVYEECLKLLRTPHPFYR